MSKQLLISHDYPPILGPEAIQSARLVTALEKEGWETDVLTVKGAACISKDGNLIIPGNKIIRAKTLESKLLKGIAYILHPSLLYSPDSKITWLPFAIKKGKEYLKNNHVDVIHSWSSPYTSHLVALNLKSIYNIRWVVHFSDPWVDNPYFPERMLEVIRRRNRKLEEAVVKGADALVFTNSETLELTMNKYSEKFTKKAFVLPHTYDEKISSISKDTINRSYGKIVISHIGNFYGPRTPEDLFWGIKKAKEKLPEIANKLSVKLIGKVSEKYIKYAKSLEIEDVVKFGGFIPYIESIKEMGDADVLLNIDAPSEKSIFLPSKLVEYIGFQKPIMALTSLEGTTSNVLNKMGHIIISNKEHEELSEVLIKIATEGINWVQINEKYIKEYSPEIVSKKLINIFLNKV